MAAMDTTKVMRKVYGRMWRATSDYRFTNDLYTFFDRRSRSTLTGSNVCKSLVAAPSRCRRRLGHRLDHRTALITVYRRPVLCLGEIDARLPANRDRCRRRNVAQRYENTNYTQFTRL